MFSWIIFQPENILLDDNFCVKLSDFGFATIVDGDEELTGKLNLINIFAFNLFTKISMGFKKKLLMTTKGNSANLLTTLVLTSKKRQLS